MFLFVHFICLYFWSSIEVFSPRFDHTPRLKRFASDFAGRITQGLYGERGVSRGVDDDVEASEDSEKKTRLGCPWIPHQV